MSEGTLFLWILNCFPCTTGNHQICSPCRTKFWCMLANGLHSLFHCMMQSQISLIFGFSSNASLILSVSNAGCFLFFSLYLYLCIFPLIDIHQLQSDTIHIMVLFCYLQETQSNVKSYCYTYYWSTIWIIIMGYFPPSFPAHHHLNFSTCFSNYASSTFICPFHWQILTESGRELGRLHECVMSRKQSTRPGDLSWASKVPQMLAVNASTHRDNREAITGFISCYCSIQAHADCFSLRCLASRSDRPAMINTGRITSIHF